MKKTVLLFVVIFMAVWGVNVQKYEEITCKKDFGVC
jgi:hypothetical protein